MMHVSAVGRAYIESKEGLRLTAYRDIVGVWTIGYGNTGSGVKPGMSITKAEADQMLTDRLANEFEPALNKAIGNAPTTQGQFDAMASLAYNIGVGGFGHSSVLHYHLIRLYDKAADAFERWDMAGGWNVEALHERRVEEGQMYLDASPDA